MRKLKKISFTFMGIGWSMYLFFSICYSSPLFLLGWIIAITGIAIYFVDGYKALRCKKDDSGMLFTKR